MDRLKVLVVSELIGLRSLKEDDMVNVEISTEETQAKARRSERIGGTGCRFTVADVPVPWSRNSFVT